MGLDWGGKGLNKINAEMREIEGGLQRLLMGYRVDIGGMMMPFIEPLL